MCFFFVPTNTPQIPIDVHEIASLIARGTSVATKSRTSTPFTQMETKYTNNYNNHKHSVPWLTRMFPELSANHVL